jgi:aspartate aminotransferase-like enzyme
MPAQLLGQKPPEPPKPDIHPENTELFEKLRVVQEANAELVAQLAQYRAGIDPNTLLNARIAAIMETIFPSRTPEGQKAQIAVELQFEEYMSNILKEARRTVVMAQLQQGANVPPEMLDEMAKAHNQPVPPGLGKHH